MENIVTYIELDPEILKRAQEANKATVQKKGKDHRLIVEGVTLTPLFTHIKIGNLGLKLDYPARTEINPGSVVNIETDQEVSLGSNRFCKINGVYILDETDNLGRNAYSKSDEEIEWENANDY